MLGYVSHHLESQRVHTPQVHLIQLAAALPVVRESCPRLLPLLLQPTGRKSVYTNYNS